MIETWVRAWRDNSPRPSRVNVAAADLIVQASGLRRLFLRGDRKHVRPDHLNRIEDILARLNVVDRVEEMALPGYRLHPLRGDLQGLWSVTVSGNWRITFRFEDGDVYDVDLTDYH